LPTGQILAVGGYNLTNDKITTLNSAELYTP